MKVNDYKYICSAYKLETNGEKLKTALIKAQKFDVYDVSQLFIIRAAIIQDLIYSHLEIEQIVYHGPGYDTFGYFTAQYVHDKASYYQIDKQEVLEFKNKVVANKFTSNYAKPLFDDWCSKLSTTGFDGNFSFDILLIFSN